MAKKQKSKKTATEITDTAEVRIVEVSLQNPDYGASRLVPLLEQEGITVTTSAVYTILKRNNLQNRTLRLARLEELGAAEIVPEPADTIEPPADVEAPVPAQTIEVTPESPKSPVIKSLSKFTGRQFLPYTVPSLLVLGVVAYFLVSALGNFLQAGRKPVLTPQSAPTKTTTKTDATVRPLEDYSIIMERNLFGGSESETPAMEETVSVEDIPTAEKSLGLKLIGTVAGDDAAISFAIIDNKKTRKQELYHEGDKAGEVLIKRILRNRVVIDAGRGDELLTLELLQDSGKRLDLSSVQQQTETTVQSNGRHRDLQLDRKEVEASLADIEGLIQQVNLTPYTLGNQPQGFMITEIPPDSVLTKMGLRSGDVVKAINDKTVTGPDEAVAFFQNIKESHEVEIQLTRRRRPISIRLKIQ